ncbi:Hypothetical predicted protein [Podarcis lilfordi]|uniref:Uncharacterized protein n=1 Tax=Podarcis lilfordi TaxID=74358 RepID=A0AA35L226_9SAUR|nr:Hypothetical predicted protein [Podarcis lilfordi]
MVTAEKSYKSGKHRSERFSHGPAPFPVKFPLKSEQAAIHGKPNCCFLQFSAKEWFSPGKSSRTIGSMHKPRDIFCSQKASSFPRQPVLNIMCSIALDYTD